LWSDQHEQLLGGESLLPSLLAVPLDLTLKTVKVVLPMRPDSGVTQGGHGCGKRDPV
jgi:hypothetical protein